MAERKLKGTDPKAAKPSRPKIVIFGKPGVGKTWGSLDFPSVYYVDTEGGANLEHYTDKLKASGGAYLGPNDGANSFDTVIEEIVTLATTKHQFRTLVIDSFSKLFNTQVDMTYEQMAKGDGADRKPRDMDKTFGAEKKPAIAATRRLIRWCDKLDMNVLLICHEKSLWADGKEVGTAPDAWDKLSYELHLSLQIIKQGASRKARVMKSRLSGFPDGTAFDWSYHEFAKRFGRDVIEGEAQQLLLASPEHVSRLATLVDVLRIPADVTDKWREKAGVEDWSEMDAETVAKCISYCESKLPPVAASTAA
jgi:hypothetical protein